MKPYQKKDIQIISLGNAYETISEKTIPYSSLNDIFVVDEKHFSQKALFWNTPYGQPDIAIITKPLSASSQKTIKKIPHSISPVRHTSSICLDFISDKKAVNELEHCLDPDRPIYIAPFVCTPQAEEFARWLQDKGFILADWKDQ